eukprot:COSAG05_NODE_1853_length_3957_cov_1.878434_5_plen_50_part_00
MRPVRGWGGCDGIHLRRFHRRNRSVGIHRTIRLLHLLLRVIVNLETMHD